MFQAMVSSLEHDRQQWSVDLQLGKSLLEVRDEVMGERSDCSNTHIWEWEEAEDSKMSASRSWGHREGWGITSQQFRKLEVHAPTLGVQRGKTKGEMNHGL